MGVFERKNWQVLDKKRTVTKKGSDPFHLLDHKQTLDSFGHITPAASAPLFGVALPAIVIRRAHSAPHKLLLRDMTRHHLKLQQKKLK